MPPNQWRFSAPWTKPQPEVSFANGAASCSFNGSGLMPVDQYPLSLTGGPSVQPGELWHFSSLASPSFPEPGYPHALSTGQLVPEPQPEGKYEPLLSLLQPERCLTHPQESASWEDSNSAGSTGLLFNLPPSSAHCKEMPPSTVGGLLLIGCGWECVGMRWDGKTNCCLSSCGASEGQNIYLH